jgi:hypothetical protein
LTDLERNIKRQAMTSESGTYVVNGLAAGRFTLQVMKQGFDTANYNDLSIEVGQRATVDVSLKIGGTTQTIDVKGETPRLETDSNAIGAVIDNRRVEQLPLNGRNFLQLAVLSGGVETPPSGAPADRASAQTGHSARTINIGGNFESVTTYLVDGIATRGLEAG